MIGMHNIRVGKKPGFSGEKNPTGFFGFINVFIKKNRDFIGFFGGIFYFKFFSSLFIDINSDKNKFLTHDSYFKMFRWVFSCLDFWVGFLFPTLQYIPLPSIKKKV